MKLSDKLFEIYTFHPKNEQTNNTLMTSNLHQYEGKISYITPRTKILFKTQLISRNFHWQ